MKLDLVPLNYENDLHIKIFCQNAALREDKMAQRHKNNQQGDKTTAGRRRLTP